MIEKVKQWFGIEGVKVQLLLPEAVKKSSGMVSGKLQFSTMHPQTVTEIRLKIVERYTRGRRSEKQVTEYEIGAVRLPKNIEVPAEQPVLLDFELPFELLKSEMDELGDKNILLSGLAKVAKLSRGVVSEYRVECEVTVRGTRLSPFAEQVVSLV